MRTREELLAIGLYKMAEMARQPKTDYASLNPVERQAKKYLRYAEALNDSMTGDVGVGEMLAPSVVRPAAAADTYLRSGLLGALSGAGAGLLVGAVPGMGHRIRHIGIGTAAGGLGALIRHLDAAGDPPGTSPLYHIPDGARLGAYPGALLGAILGWKLGRGNRVGGLLRGAAAGAVAGATGGAMVSNWS